MFDWSNAEVECWTARPCQRRHRGISFVWGSSPNVNDVVSGRPGRSGNWAVELGGPKTFRARQWKRQRQWARGGIYGSRKCVRLSGDKLRAYFNLLFAAICEVTFLFIMDRHSVLISLSPLRGSGWFLDTANVCKSNIDYWQIFALQMANIYKYASHYRHLIFQHLSSVLALCFIHLLSWK
jgi:hypothetical protein